MGFEFMNGVVQVESLLLDDMG